LCSCDFFLGKTPGLAPRESRKFGACGWRERETSGMPCDIHCRKEQHYRFADASQQIGREGNGMCSQSPLVECH